MTAARAALWRDAEALSAAAGAQLSPRMRRLAVRGDRPLAFSEIGQAPVWASADPAERARLIRLTGAVLVSRSWSREISGVVLGRAAEAVGDEALEDLINLPAVVAPEALDPAAASGDAQALDRLGASALIAAADGDVGLADRLAHLFSAGLAAPVKPTQAALATRTAEGLRRQADDPGGGMSFVLVKGAGGLALATDAWRIPAAEVARLRTAVEAAEALDADRAAAAGRLAAEREQSRAEGYAAGLEEGRRAGAAEAAKTLAALVREVRGDAADTRADLGRLSLDVVRRVAAEVGPQAMLEAVAERAVRDTLSQQPLVVRVAPAAAAGVAARLWPLNAEVEVEADPAVAEGDCIVASRSGAAHAGLEVQLAALDRAFADVAP